MFKTNEYFGGKVKSLAFNTIDCPATVGVMAKGEYTFGTSSIEHMTLISGKMQVKLPGEETFKNVSLNKTFVVEANKKFEVKIEEESAYLCLYK